MGDVGAHFLGALGEQSLGRIAERAAGIDDVVDQDAALALDVADDAVRGGGAARDERDEDVLLMCARLVGGQGRTRESEGRRPSRAAAAPLQSEARAP